MVSTELVKEALCFFLLTVVSVSKCEIDSLTAKTHRNQETPSPTSTTTSSSFLSPPRVSSQNTSSAKAGKTFFSFSSSSSGGLVAEVSSPSISAVTLLPTGDANLGQRTTQQFSHPPNINIIKSTISQNRALPTLTSRVPLEHLETEEVAQDVKQMEKGGESALKSYFQKDTITNSRPFVVNPFQSETNFTGFRLKETTSIPRFVQRVPLNESFSRSLSFSPLPLPPPKVEQDQARNFYEGRHNLVSTSGLSLEGKFSDLDTSPVPRHTYLPAGLTFSCRNRVPGYYADASQIAKCQVYHMCMTDGRKYTMLCGIGTVFNQVTFVCDHWYNYKCSDAEADYKINSQLWADLVSPVDDYRDDPEDDLDQDGNDGKDAIEDDTAHPSRYPLSFRQLSKRVELMKP